MFDLSQNPLQLRLNPQSSGSSLLMDIQFYENAPRAIGSLSILYNNESVYITFLNEKAETCLANTSYEYEITHHSTQLLTLYEVGELYKPTLILYKGNNLLLSNKDVNYSDKQCQWNGSVNKTLFNVSELGTTGLEFRVLPIRIQCSNGRLSACCTILGKKLDSKVTWTSLSNNATVSSTQSDLAFEHGVQSCVNTGASGVHKYKCRFEAYDGRYIEGLATAWVFGML